MTTPVSELIARREAVERQIRELQSVAKAEAISRIRALMADHGLTVEDLSARVGAGSRNGNGSGVSRVAPKYRDPVTGSTWSGRGLKPKWLAAALESGKAIEEFAIRST